MRKLNVCILILAITVLSFYLSLGTALAEDNSYGYDFMVDFVTANPNRVAGSSGELGAAEYIADFFINIGLTPYNDKLGREGYYMPFTKDGINSRNVIGIKKASVNTNKYVIIGAHYDAVFAEANGKTSQGAYDNGSGIGALAQIANSIVVEDTDVNVMFIAFGAEEVGMFGSTYFVDNLSADEKQNIMLMINMDVISCGDYLYLYTDEVRSRSDDYIYNRAEELGVSLRRTPKDMKVIMVRNEYNGFNYSHSLFYSDHAPFMREGIEAYVFVGYNMEIPIIEPRESKDKPNIMHTELDNLDSSLR